METIKELERAHRSEIDEVFHQFNFCSIANVLQWKFLFDLIQTVPGDLVECGTGRARSLLIMSALQLLLGQEKQRRQIFAYDSFQGFPEPSAQDRSPRNPKRGEWSASPSGKYKYSPEFIRKVLEEADIPLPSLEISIRPGFFSESLKNHPDRPIALLHVDCDLYQSYLDVLRQLFERVAPGGLVVFDDLMPEKPGETEPFPGARLAVKEFLGADYSKLQKSPFGVGYFIK